MPFISKRKVYKPKFAKMLKDGMRKDHRMSIEKCCQEFGCSTKSFQNWRDDIKEFREACEIADIDYKVACMDMGWDLIEGKRKGDAKTYQLFMGVFFGMSSKIESTVKHEEQIKTININVVPGRQKELPVIIDQAPVIKRSPAWEKLAAQPPQIKYPKGYIKPTDEQ